MIRYIRNIIIRQNLPCEEEAVMLRKGEIVRLLIAEYGVYIRWRGNMKLDVDEGKSNRKKEKMELKYHRLLLREYFIIIIFNRILKMSSLQTNERPKAKKLHLQENNQLITNKMTKISSSSNILKPQTPSNKPSQVSQKKGKRNKVSIQQQIPSSCKKHAQGAYNFQKNIQFLERQEQNCQNYFLRKTIMALYKYFEKNCIKWNLYALKYSQLISILQELGYIKVAADASSSEVQKKCYWIWLNISSNKSYSLVNLIIILCCIEHLEYDQQIIKQIVIQLSKGIERFELQKKQQDPKYIYFVKRQSYLQDDDSLKLQKKDIEKIGSYLKDFRLNKLTKNIAIEQQKQEESNCISISKKSEILAESKRQKIQTQIKQQQPHIKQIQLYHLLNYKQTKCKEKIIKTEGYTSKSKQEKISPVQMDYLMEEEVSQKKSKHTNTNTKRKAQRKRSESKKDIQKCKTNKLSSQQSISLRKSTKFQSRQQSKLQSASSFEMLSRIEDKNSHVKFQIIDELQWDEIPKADDQVNLQLQLQQDLNFQPPLSHIPNHTIQPKQQQKQTAKDKRRRQFIDLPILFVDVNIDQGKKQRIIIYQGDKASDLAIQFGKRHNLNSEMIIRLQGLLEQQIGSILTKIEQAHDQDCSWLY